MSLRIGVVRCVFLYSSVFQYLAICLVRHLGRSVSMSLFLYFVSLSLVISFVIPVVRSLCVS